MANTRRSRLIAARQQAIWDVLADFGALSEWSEGADHSCLLSRGPDGAALGSTRRVQLGRATLIEGITEFEAPSALAYDVQGLPTLLGKLSNRWTLQPRGTSTEVSITSTAHIGANRVVGAAEWAVTRVMAKQSDSMLAGLARRVESSHGG